ncbi:MAG: ABC transporter permease [Phycisphaerales bacterium]|nr:ABC transporter permease [Planctomycetota bacterium]MCH8507804.1 ABC transporter permease [Phycisphaerales bacterium]
MTVPTNTTRPQQPESVTGVQLAQGIGHRPTQGFWTEAWSQVIRRPGAIFGLTWIGIIAFFAVFAPIVASGHPIIARDLSPDGETLRTYSPMLANLRATDILLLIAAFVAVPMMIVNMKIDRGTRLSMFLIGGLQAGLILVALTIVHAMVTSRDASDWMRNLEQQSWFGTLACFTVSLLISAPMVFLMPFERLIPRAVTAAVVGLVVAIVTTLTWTSPIERFEYRQLQAQGRISAVYTVIPFSPLQGDTTLNLKPPGSNLLRPAIDRFQRSPAIRAELNALASRDPGFGDLPIRQRLEAIPADETTIDLAAIEIMAQSQLLSVPAEGIVEELRSAWADGRIANTRDIADWIDALPIERFHLGTDALGQDMLSQLLHACRLSISIGLVSTLIAVVIGVTVGALMGYFGGWVDLMLYRVVEIFMAIPVLFLLIVAAAVLPRNTYVMMAIIGCVTWTGAARFVRAEFYKLRNQDFVQSARAVGLPLRSILFKHMLPNGVTPVLVDASFAIAAAILAEATLSFLGLGPANQASWGRLLSDATNQVGAFVWWLAIFPGLAIFLTVLAYNLIGEAFRDAIDPKLKKARV